MEAIVAVEIPRQRLEEVSEEQPTLQQIFRMGLYQYRCSGP